MQIFPPRSIEDVIALPYEQIQIVTANNRLAVFIKEQLIKRSERKVVALPQITSYKVWLEKLAQQSRFANLHSALGLDEFSQQWIWRQAIEEVEKVQPLLNIAQAAANASQAHRQLSEWDIQVRPEESSQEYERFLQWRTSYEQKRDALAAWDTPQTIQASLEAIEQGKIRHAQHIFLSGFYSLNPQQKKLLQAMQNQGSELYDLHLAKQQAEQLTVYVANDDLHELESAILWAKQTLLERHDTHIAIVNPDLQTDIARIHRLLQRHLGGSHLSYHVAVGRPLNEWALVRSAMAWLTVLAAMHRQKVDLTLFGQALIQACFGASQMELSRFVQLDVQLRKGEAVSLRAEAVIDSLFRYAPVFARKFDKLYQETPSTPMGSADWAQFVRHFLTVLEFPGPNALSSENYQVCHAFERVLKHLAALDEVINHANLEQIVSVLNQLLTQTQFQPKRDAKSRLDVVGLYEVEGGQWDAAWVLGLHDDALPSLAKPNPFIPVSSQRRAQVLHATPESEMFWSRQIFASILHSVPELILSWPQESESKIMRPSAFLNGLTMMIPLEAAPVVSRPSIQLETIEDKQGLPASSGDFKGGYSALEQQARNPLWAYASTRLGLEALGTYPQYELTHLNRGNFYHKVLELVWTGLRDSSALQDETCDIENLVEQCIQVAAKETLKSLSSPSLKKLEQARAKELICQLLEEEKKRTPFSVEQKEQKVTFDVDGLCFNFTIDRIDRLDDGSRVYIDYKTGTLPSIKELQQRWLERERIIDLQLPLYASCLGLDAPQNIAAITYSGLKRHSIGYLGIGQTDLDIGKKVNSVTQAHWEEIVASWKHQISRLISEIALGVADNRYEQVTDMDYCEVMPFLRCHMTQEGEGDE